MMVMASWIAATLRQSPEIAIFLTLALGYYFAKFPFKGIGLGSVTATLLAGVLIGQLGITISAPLKATVFLLFLFAVGYGVGPQFVRGVTKDRSEEHTSELQSRLHLVCRLLLEKKKENLAHELPPRRPRAVRSLPPCRVLHCSAYHMARHTCGCSHAHSGRLRSHTSRDDL